MINYTEVGRRIKERREFLGLSLNKAGHKIGCTATTLRRWENGEIASIKTTKLKAIAEALATTPEYLLGLEEKIMPREDLMPIPEMRSIPILGEIAYGEPILRQENYAGEANIPSNIKADFALRAKGDSMINARIFDGDLVFIKQQSDIDSGEVAAILIDDEITLKRVYKYEGRLELRSENPMYKPINIEGVDLADIKIIGRAIAFIGNI